MKESKIFRLRDNDGNILIESDDPLEFLFLLGKLEEEEEEDEKPCCDKCGSCRTCCDDESDDEDEGDDDDEDDEDDEEAEEDDCGDDCECVRVWIPSGNINAYKKYDKEVDLSDLLGTELFHIMLDPVKTAAAAVAIVGGLVMLRRLWKRRR